MLLYENKDYKPQAHSFLNKCNATARDKSIFFMFTRGTMSDNHGYIRNSFYFGLYQGWQLRLVKFRIGNSIMESSEA